MILKELFRQRINNPLINSLQQGKRFFILYGDGIKDVFLESIGNGVLSLKENVQNCFLYRDDCEIFVTVNTDGVTVVRNRDGRIIDITESYLKVQEKEDSEMPDDEEEGGIPEKRKQSDAAKDVEDNMNSNGVNIINSIGIVKNNAINDKISDKKTAVFFEDFEWLAKLYSSSNNSSLEYIKLIKDFYKIDQCYTIISIEDVELLKKYSFEIKGSNVIFLGNPSAEEVKYTYLLNFLGKTNFEKKSFQIDLFEQIKKISEAISSSKKSLREAIQVLDTIILAQNKKSIDSTDFEIAIEKITAERVSLNDVVINPEEKNNIINAIEAFMEGEKNNDYRKGFILTGPPGTGKTLIVKALSNEYNMYFMSPKLSDLKGEYVGQSSGKVKRIFDEARANAPTIMFIDEADTVFPSRGLGSGMSDSYNLDMVNQFLQEIDGMTSGKEKIFVIAATNRVNIIDEAIQSRLTERIPIGLPNAENRMKIFNKKLEKYNFSFDGKKYYNEIQEKSINMSGRDIENFVKLLNERIKETEFKKISNLGNDEESREQILKILEINENKLIEDLQKSVPVEIKNPSSIVMGIDDIIGYNAVKERIKRQAEYIRSSEKYKSEAIKYGIKVSKGVLLYGPPGNGKSMLAQAIAKDNNFYFVKVLSKDFMSDSLTKQLDNLQIIFDRVTRLSKMCSRYDGVLLFFDEFDSLASYGMNNVIRGTLLDYLASGEKENDTGIRSAKSKILLVAATNFEKLLDPAVIRKGRIDDHILMDNPTNDEGVNILKQKFETDNFAKLGEGVELDYVYNKLTDLKQSEKEETDDEDDNKSKKKKKDTRPSGSDIINCFEELKAEAFRESRGLNNYKNETDDRNEVVKEIFVTKDIVNRYFGNV